MILIHIIIFDMSFMDMKGVAFFMLSSLIREKSFLLWPLMDCCFMGVHLDLLTLSCIVCMKGVIVFILDCFLLVESEGYS